MGKHRGSVKRWSHRTRLLLRRLQVAPARLPSASYRESHRLMPEQEGPLANHAFFAGRPEEALWWGDLLEGPAAPEWLEVQVSVPRVSPHAEATVDCGMATG
jgi:hypothetical protein